MKIDEKLLFVEKMVKFQSDNADKDRKHAKMWAFYLKIGGVFLAGIITILIGLRIETTWSDLVSNVALILGASLTVINALDSFFDHRLYWIYKSAIYYRYNQLLGEIEFYKNGLDISEYDQNTVTQFMSKYNEIFEDDRKSWVQLRKQELSKDLVVK